MKAKGRRDYIPLRKGGVKSGQWKILESCRNLRKFMWCLHAKRDLHTEYARKSWANDIEVTLINTLSQSLDNSSTPMISYSAIATPRESRS